MLIKTFQYRSNYSSTLSHLNLIHTHCKRHFLNLRQLFWLNIYEISFAISDNQKNASVIERTLIEKVLIAARL